jgi:hypothetical protein
VGEDEAGEGHCDASGCCKGGAIEDAGAEIAGGKPGSDELTGEVGGEESSGLCVLNVPVLDERGEKRAEHDSGDAGCEKVDEDRDERARRVG